MSKSTHRPSKTRKSNKGKAHRTRQQRNKRNLSPSEFKPSKFKMWLGVLMGVVLAVAVLIYASVFAKTDKQALSLTVKQGDTYQGVLINQLWQTHPLANQWFGRLYLKFAADKPLQAGVYPIPAQANLHKVVQILQKGTQATMVRVQIIEGKTTKELYQTLKNTDGIRLELLSAAKDNYTWLDVAKDNEQVVKALGIKGDNPEGWFAPDTYFFAQGVSDKVILQTLYKRQQSLVDKAWQDKAANLPYQSPSELLIMASIIERETGLVHERGKVAAVFVNRLQQNMRLQTDPTIIYGLFDRYDGTIYQSNLDEKTPYNTYQIDGLPPTPIALPSMQALHAAAHPDETDVLYFVATGKGGHTFSRTLDEHNQAVAAYRRTIQEP